MIDLLVIPTGRRLRALERVREAIVEGEAEAPLAARVDAALAKDRATHALEARYGGQTSKAQHGENAPVIDAELDRAVNGLDDALRGNERSFGRDSEIATASRTVRKGLLPRGAGVITSLDYVEELEAVTTLLDTASKPPIATLIPKANVQPHVDRVGAVLDEFRGVVGGGKAGEVTYDKLRSARAVGQRNLRKIVVWVLGHYLDDTDENVAARERLLRPILDQNEEVHHQHASHRAVTDIDPTTGQEVAPVAGG